MNRQIFVMGLLVILYCERTASQNNIELLRTKYLTESCNRVDRHWGFSKPLLLIDYVLERRSDSSLYKYFEDKRDLMKINQLLMLNDQIEFKDSTGQFEIFFEAKKTEKDINKLGKLKFDKYNGNRYVRAVNNRDVFGLSLFTKKVSLIDRCLIQINGEPIALPDSVFSNLFFPNFNQKFENIIPAELYYSETNDCFYLYLFGFQFNDNNDSRDIRMHNTFFTKIIFDQTGYIGQISLKWGELYGYNFDCGYFIGF